MTDEYQTCQKKYILFHTTLSVTSK